MGFFTDSYDLFCIGLVTKLIGRIYYQDNPYHIGATVSPGVLPIGINAAITAIALVGTLCGQLIIGSLGDRYGRKSLYTFALCVMVLCAFGQACSFGTTPQAVISTLCFWRFCLGVGVGGDYPLSAVIMSEYSSKMSRGAFVGSIFAMQGIGYLVAAAVTAIVAAAFDAAYKPGRWSLHVYTGTFNAEGHENYCASFLWLDSAKTIPCPASAQAQYWKDIQLSCPPESDFIWRIVLAFGAVPAALTLYYRSHMAETPRFTARVEHDAKRAAADMEQMLKDEPNAADYVLVAEGESTKDTTESSKLTVDITFFEFINKYKYQIIGAALSWFFLDVAFYSQNLFQSNVFLQAGWLPPAKYMNAIEETGKVAYCQAVIALGSTIPGYWATVFTVDTYGRKNIQLMGFFFMTFFMAAAAISYHHLLNPNNDHNTDLSSDQPSNKNGWIAMYAFGFFFANFGPNSTTFIIPSELFPTRFRTTAHGFCAAMGKLGAIVGAFGFLYASQPSRGATSWSFPCGNIEYKDGQVVRLQDIVNGACKRVNSCPSGRSAPAALGAECTCNNNLLAGCYPFGINIQGALGILAATNFVGMLCTFLLPETMGKSLEELNNEEEFDKSSEKNESKMIKDDVDIEMIATISEPNPTV